MWGVYEMTETRGDRWHREAEDHLVRDGVVTVAVLLTCWAIFTTVGCSLCFGGEVHRESGTGSMRVDDVMMPEDERPVEATAGEVDPPTQDLTDEQIQGIYEETMREWYADSPIEDLHEEYAEYEPTGGLTMEGGVNYHDGRTETYYSSNVLHHYRTDEWTVDEEGFYRDDQGRYVVAASDMEQGTVFEGSKGECVVLDSGCAEGVTDYYVAW